MMLQIQIAIPIYKNKKIRQGCTPWRKQGKIFINFSYEEFGEGWVFRI